MVVLNGFDSFYELHAPMVRDGKGREEDLWRLAYRYATDGLTGAYLRQFLEINLPRFHFPLLITAVDIDNFHGINERYGHGQGDIVLRAVKCALEDCVRTGHRNETVSAVSKERRNAVAHDIVVRYGGDEFILVCEISEAPSDFSKRIERTLGQSIVKLVRAGKPESVHLNVHAVSRLAQSQADLEKVVKNVTLRKKYNRVMRHSQRISLVDILYFGYPLSESRRVA